MRPEGESEKDSVKRSFWGRYWHIIILCIFFILFILQTARYIKLNSAPPYADTNHHLALAREYHRMLIERNLDPRESQLHQKYPPLIYLNCALFFSLLDTSPGAAVWSYTVFVLVFLAALYGIGSYFGGRAGGVAAALIGVSCHFTVYMSHMFVPDMPQTALTALALFFLLKSERFTHKKYSYSFGAALGLAMLTKWSSAFYLAVPIIILLGWLSFRSVRTFLLVLVPGLIMGGIGAFFLKTGWDMYKLHPGGIEYPPAWAVPLYIICLALLYGAAYIPQRKLDQWFREENREYARSLILGLRVFIIALLICGVWYIYSIKGVAAKLDFQREEIYEPQNPRSGSLFLLSLKTYISEYKLFPLVFYPFVLAGIVFAAIRRENLLEFSMLISMGIFGMLIISPLAPPAIFYILSVVTVLSALAGYWVEYAGKLKYPLLIMIIIFAFFSAGFIFFNLEEHHKVVFNRNFFEIGLGLLRPALPDRNQYHIDQLLDNMNKERESLLKNPDFLARTDSGALRIPAGIYLTDDFRNKRGKGRGPVEREAFMALMSLARMDGFRSFYREPREEWNRCFQESRDIPVFIMAGYTESDFPGALIEEIKGQWGRESKIISSYKIDEFRSIVLIRVEVTKTES